MNAVERFKQIASEERFKGWPLAGKPELGAKIDFFGQTLEYYLETPKGIEKYISILRHFGWAVVFGLTKENNVVTLVQWKPGVNCASWELPPGGIGKVGPDAAEEEIKEKTISVYKNETGYGMGMWLKLGKIMIETGKYRGAGPNDHGLAAHLFLATGLIRIQDARKPEPNEIMETLEVPLAEFNHVLKSGLFLEASAVACALMALEYLLRG